MFSLFLVARPRDRASPRRVRGAPERRPLVVVRFIVYSGRAFRLGSGVSGLLAPPGPAAGLDPRTSDPSTG